MKTRIKINGLIIICCVFLMVIFPGAFLRQRQINFSDEFLRILGFGFIFLGQIWRVSGRGYKSEHSKNSSALVKGGPYIAVRNPMYLGILLIGLGVILVLFQWWLTVVFLSVFIIRYILLILKEEKKLLTIFSEEYKAYMQSTPCIFPSLKMMRREVSEYLPLKFAWFKKEIGSIIAVVSLTLLVELWQSIRLAILAVYCEESAAVIILILLFSYLAFYLYRKTNEFKQEIPIKS